MANERLKGKTLKVSGLLEEFEKDAIKDKVDIVALFAEFGVELKQKGKNYTGRCPWHEDKTPSLSVDREKGLYNCFGCGESGDVVTLVEKMKRLPFKDALKFLQQHVGAVQVPKTSEPRRQEEQELPAREALTHDLTLTTVADFYHKKLFENRAALAYLEGRGFKNQSLFTRFKLGYADGGLLKVTANGQREALKVLGLLRDTGTEHLSGCITFPVTDERDQVLTLYGRRSGDTEPKHLYLAGPHRGVWNRKASKVYDEIILTECIIDGLSLVALGFENVQACYGTNGFTAEHLQALKDDRVKTVTIGFDADEAGRKAAAKLKDKLLGEGFTVKTIEPPKGKGPGPKDWNEFLVSGGTKEDVAAILAAAKAAEPLAAVQKSFRVVKEGGAYEFEFADLTYRLLGVKDVFVQDLRVNIRAQCGEDSFYDRLDLYSARSRAAYAASLAALFAVEAKRIERDLIQMLEHLEDQRDKALSAGAVKPEELSAEEKALGLELLKSPDLFDQVAADMTKLGYVGEELNKKLIYLAASSRVLDDPISVLILSQSAAGKSLLVDTVKKLIPADEVISITSLSDQALNYIPSLMNKFLILGEAVHNEVIEHQIREMLSGKELSRLVTLKDPKTGELSSTLVKTPAVVAAVMSTTRQNINPENSSRFFLVNADETREQTKKIHEAQRKKYTLERYEEKSTLIPAIVRKHHAAQRLLRNVLVVNEFATRLDFPDMLMRTRRDHDRFMDLIAAVCFLRQYQKTPQMTADGREYVACDLDDYRIAYEIMVGSSAGGQAGILSATLLELPKSAVELYEALRELARETAKKDGLKVHEKTFTQREVREHTGFSHTWIKYNLRLLVDYEYLVLTRGGKERFRGVYRLREDKDVKSFNFSMIPSPEEMQKKFKSGPSGHLWSQSGQ
jgi:DNA primase